MVISEEMSSGLAGKASISSCLEAIFLALSHIQSNRAEDFKTSEGCINTWVNVKKSNDLMFQKGEEWAQIPHAITYNLI